MSIKVLAITGVTAGIAIAAAVATVSEIRMQHIRESPIFRMCAGTPTGVADLDRKTESS
jgi:hypothetical protein